MNASCLKLPHYAFSCQTYEGGFGGVPSAEAHGGYTFCAVAALAILGKIHLLHVASLVRWLAFRQMRFEGGFQVGSDTVRLYFIAFSSGSNKQVGGWMLQLLAGCGISDIGICR